MPIVFFFTSGRHRTCGIDVVRMWSVLKNIKLSSAGGRTAGVELRLIRFHG